MIFGMYLKAQSKIFYVKQNVVFNSKLIVSARKKMPTILTLFCKENFSILFLQTLPNTGEYPNFNPHESRLNSHTYLNHELMQTLVLYHIPKMEKWF